MIPRPTPSTPDGLPQPLVADSEGDAQPPKAASAGFSQSLERGLLILSSFSENRPVLGISDLGRAVGLNRSTTYRYVATLAKLGYLQQDPNSRKYSLGPRVVDLGFAAINSMEITRVAGPLLQALSDETGYTVSMAVLDGPDVVYVDRRRSGRAGSFAMGLQLHVGSRLPAYCTSMGKVLLAYQEPAALRDLVDRTDLARRGPKTITVREQLLVALNRVRRTGFALNDEELAPGLRSLAAPVRDRSGVVVAAVNIAVHLTVWNASVDSVMSRLEHPLRRATTEISTRLGYRPPTSSEA
ncbi:IclR family transcriptional regulator [Streptomyces sp. ISID311]|uniref:IclR family transcriptional regulator n=1 Tax=Streptomyces sp. ISID311 TaxID=2601673 RepID=UPI0011BD2F77|nr:IclR family transcriptional regulator [Streptomyces sp. ISID311]TXC99837.1 IclR family transcriptional regulator [Streptomyces sp. ISID311]